MAKMYPVIKNVLISILVMFLVIPVFATGEPSTYFQIYVPPNNDAVKRDAALIITAIYDSTSFEIIDDGADGDTDDTKSGLLMAGQSYILYIRDNGINDDARYASGGVLKWDGDYFIVKSNRLVFASQSTNSDWQHDWVPSTDKKSIGQKFIIYAPLITSSKRDVNVFAYENNTTITFQKISWQSKTNSGYTDVNFESATTIFTRTLNVGEDIIYKYTDGRDVMNSGDTYMILADKPITVQYGALFGNERDGGGYVPSSNGSSSGSLLYFAVPFQAVGEQEIRIVSWDDNNDVILERYNNGAWVNMKTLKLNKMQAGDWVGKANGNVSFATVFRVTCTGGKRVSVFEGNWFETGSPGTSDMATMVSAENGTSSGRKFLTYIAPPGNEQNAVDPFTGKAFGQQMSHLYIFAKNGASVTVKDAYTNGTKFNKTFTINAERYIDCSLTLTEWKNIYNGTGTASGAERPYLLVESNDDVSVMNSNFNDNWMCYVGSSLTQAFTQTSSSTQTNAIPKDTVMVESVLTTGSEVTDSKVQVVVQDGLKVVSCRMKSKTRTTYGEIDEQPTKTVVTFTEANGLEAKTDYTIQTEVVATVGSNTGALLTGSTNASVETIVTGTVSGQIQESSATQVVNVNTQITSQLQFSRFSDNLLTKDSTDSWTTSWIDINKDGYDDIFVTDRRANKPNLLYINNAGQGFTRGQSLIQDTAISTTHTWADIDNDGDADLLVLNNTRKTNTFYLNNNGVLSRDNSKSFTKEVSYYHGGSFADYDNDGKVDLFMCNFFPTKFNELHKNKGDGRFTKEVANVIPAEANQSVGASWADYDGDGYMDLFVPNGSGFKNSLFHNEGNGTFSKVKNIVGTEGGQSIGSCWGDYDNDGDLDLLVTNSNSMGNFLYRNEGKGNFSKVTTGVVVTDKGSSHGCSFADIDNDADLDIYITNGGGFKFLYLNDGNGNFSKKDDEIINFNYGNSFGHAWSDFDRDGDLDLMVATHSNQPNALFTNNGNANNWLEILLEGVVSNKSAIGADILVYTKDKIQLREVNSQSGFGGMSSFTQHFGLGQSAEVDSIKIKWPSGAEQLLLNPTINTVLTIVEPKTVRLSGAVYFDKNGNGIKDEEESLVARAAVKLAPSNILLHANDEGYFATELNTGMYTLDVVNDKGVNASAKTQSVKVEGISTVLDTVWLAAETTCNGTDVGLVMGSTAIRKGFANNQFTIIVTNNGRSAAERFELKLKTPVSLVISNLSVPFKSAETVIESGLTYKLYTWTLDKLMPFENSLISFTHSTDASVAIGDLMSLNAWFEGLLDECNVVDNSIVQTYKVVGAIDPNDLAVAPVGYGKEGFIQANQLLTYTIRFQNVGNHAAELVRITDVLPAGIDAATMKLVSTSHEGMAVTVNNQTISFFFDGINLPDSVSNEAASHGFIMFTVQPRAGILAGTVLKNKVSIQFDHYETIETNEVINTIQSKQQEEQALVVKTFPNPAADVVYVSMVHKHGDYTSKKLVSADLLDMTGRLILHKSFHSEEELRFDIPIHLKGFCFVKLTDSEGSVYTKKIVLARNK